MDNFIPDKDQEFNFEGFNIDAENTYYRAKGIILFEKFTIYLLTFTAIKEKDPLRAVDEFKQVILLETIKGNWKGIPLFKTNCEIAVFYYKELLSYTKFSITKNYSEKSIHDILDYVSLGNDMKFMKEMYSITLLFLEETKNERLWLKVNLKLAKLWLDTKEYRCLNNILNKLRNICENHDGSFDQLKSTYLFEVYALQIQMYSEMKNNRKLKDLYHKILKTKSEIIHPYIMGVIRECGGKMYMREKKWKEAQIDFYESFKNYDEVGSPHGIRALKYLILATMLSDSDINHFDSQEINSYKNHSQFLAMMDLMNAYKQRDAQKIELVLREHHDEIMEDIFMRTYIDDILRNFRTQMLLNLISSHTQISISFIEKELNIAASDIETLLVNLILDERIHGKIDQVNQILTLKTEDELSENEAATHALVDNIDKLWKFCLNRQS
ncbi:hypothetical protein PORY_000813 [Pneumocystis oryctolagi]|uniref:Uncharacterized protein n=1 Tax=Pneumocystis oryctolagi TaxID=42067 RepID=A0ACB7CFZ3_9ASCO|nr:hypothetical protein PORY_000813 [Pneumocystis oryctolagi]